MTPDIYDGDRNEKREADSMVECPIADKDMHVSPHRPRYRIGSNMYPLVVIVNVLISLIVAHGQRFQQLWLRTYFLYCYGVPKDWSKHKIDVEI